jgi:hypothetical protein
MLTWEKVMNFKSLIVAAVAATGFAGAASATSLIDFTDSSVWSSGSSTDTVLGSTVSLTSVPPGSITVNNPGPVGVNDGGLGLAFDGDGLGVRDDEITSPGQSITVLFSGAGLNVAGFAFLDLFIADDASEREVADVEFDDGTVMSFDAQSKGNGGFAYYAIAPKRTTSLTFTAESTNDKRADPDYALAAIEVAPIPLPAAGWMFISALAGMGFLSRRRRATA